MMADINLNSDATILLEIIKNYGNAIDYVLSKDNYKDNISISCNNKFRTCGYDFSINVVRTRVSTGIFNISATIYIDKQISSSVTFNDIEIKYDEEYDYFRKLLECPATYQAKFESKKKGENNEKQ